MKKMTWMALAMTTMASTAMAQTVYYTVDSLDQIKIAPDTFLADVPAGSGNPLPSDIDFAGGKLYFNDLLQDKIFQVELNGTVSEVVTFSGTTNSIAVSGNTIYFDDGTTDTIRSVSTSGGAVTLLVDTTSITDSSVYSSTRTPRGVNVAGGKLWWTDSSADLVFNADLNGANAQVVADTRAADGGQSTSPFALAVDIPGDKLYWTEGSRDNIFVSDLDGSNAGLFVDLDTLGLGTSWNPVDLEVFEGSLYLADASYDGVIEIDIATKAATALTPSGSIPARGVAVIPEPMTLALLGLGGLAAMRRRRA